LPLFPLPSAPLTLSPSHTQKPFPAGCSSLIGGRPVP
jgi:hypothetical protein